MTEEDIKGWVGRKLGGGVVCVELSDDQYGDAVDAAKLWYAGYMGQVKWSDRTPIQITEGTNEYGVQSDVESVVDVVFGRDGEGILGASDWTGFANLPIEAAWMNGVQEGSYSSLVQVLQYREQAKVIMSIDLDWEWDESSRKIRLFPSSSAHRATAFRYQYITNAVDVETLPQRNVDLLRQYALAEAMETLGMIRTKFGTIPSAAGEMNLNGDTLLSQAETRKSGLDEKILKLQKPTGMVAG